MAAVAILGIMAALVLLGSAALLIGKATVPSRFTLNGEIRAADARQQVILPKYARISTMLVHEGDRVDAGDILFLLDEVTLRQKFAALNRQRVALRLRRECLLVGDVPTGNMSADQITATSGGVETGESFIGNREGNNIAAEMPEISALTETADKAIPASDLMPEPDPGPDLRFAFLAARKSCALTTARIADDAMQRQTDIDRMGEQVRIIERRINLLARRARDGDSPLQSRLGHVTAGLSLKLTKSLLEGDIARLEKAARDAENVRQSDNLQAAHALSDDIDALSLALSQLQVLMDNPEIRAPSTGEIYRIRQTGNAVFEQDAPVIELSATHEGPYAVTAMVPGELLTALDTERRVLIRIVGLGAETRPLSGRLDTGTPPRPTGDGNFLISVKLTEGSQSDLKNRHEFKALRSVGAGAELRIEGQRQRLDGALADRLRRALPRPFIADALPRVNDA